MNADSAGRAATTVQSVQVRAVCLPLANPHRTAGGVVSESPLVLIDLRTRDGVVGRSLIFTYTRAALASTAELVRNLAHLVEGEALAPVALHHGLARRFRLLGTQGLVGMALAGLDMALWDALARRQGGSLVEALGGVVKPIPVYGAVGYDGVQGSARAAEQWANRGFTGVKAKIGYPSVKEDLAVIRAMREAVGDGVAIMVDYNQSLSPIEAIERLRALEHEDLVWVEEPTLAHDYAGHARVSRAVRVPIQTGENWWGTQDMHHALMAGASSYVMPDAMKIGGVTGWLGAAALAQTHAMPMSSHLYPELSAQLLCVTPTAHWLEHVDWWDALLVSPLQVENGITRLDGVVGSGLEWNERAAAEYGV